VLIGHGRIAAARDHEHAARRAHGRAKDVTRHILERLGQPAKESVT
jgi:hypothetical protein